MMNLFGGGMLTGEKIRQEVKKGKIVISDYDPECVNPNSYNLKLHPQLLIYKRDAARANIVSGTMPKVVQASVEEACYLDSIKDKSLGRIIVDLCTYKENNNDKNVEDKVKLEEDLVENSIEFGTNKIVHEIACDGLYKIIENCCCDPEYSITNSIKNVSDLTDDIKKSMYELTMATCVDIQTIASNDVELEKSINTLAMYPNISSAALPPLDMHKNNETIEFEIPKEGFVLQPGVLYIGRTKERTFTDKYIPMINGRSSGGRLGISIHICAGFGDIGFDGTWTLEITCVEPVRIYPDSEIAQVCFFKPYGKVKDLYRGRYFRQEKATASRFYRNRGDNSDE